MANTLNLGNGDWATKENSLLGYNSESGNYKPLPFDFTRASNGTFVNKSGLIETAANGVPRIDFLGNTKGALKLEPQRTNLLPYSSEINDTRWTDNYGGTGVGPVMNSSTELAKDGTLSACEWVFNTGSGTTISDQSSIYYSSIPTSVGVTYSFSVWVYSSLNNVEIQLRGAGSVYEKFTLTIGWNKITRIAEATSTSTLPIIGLRQSVNGTVNSNITVSLWGAQLEQGSYATSLINTQGSAVTRVVDVCSQTVPDGIIGQTEGVVYIDFLSVNNFDGNGGNLFEIKEDNNNRINIYFSNGTPRLFGIEDASGVFNQALSLTTGSVCKLAIKYNSTSTKVFINGSLSHTLNGINNIAFSDYSFLPNNNIDYNEIKLYNTALTDAELAALTTI
jgi:hypothetical protein